LTICSIALFFWASSASFEGLVRQRLVSLLEESTGGKVEIASFHWHLLDLEAEANGVVVHGLEAPGEAPYAAIGSLRARLRVLGFWSPRVLLRDLDAFQPSFHLIVFPDGSTNQPRPRKPRKAGKPLVDTIFDLEAGRVSVEQGILLYQKQAIPLDFSARDVSLRMSYLPAVATIPGDSSASPAMPANNTESYHLEASATDLSLSRSKAPPAEGTVQAALDLTRTGAILRSLRITSRSRGTADRSLEISGELTDFAHPRWQAKAAGDLDLTLAEPILGYPHVREGTARLALTGAGQAGLFRADGQVHIENGAWIGDDADIRGVLFDAHVHADPEQLLVTSAVARLPGGGQVEGVLTMDHWLSPLPGEAVLRPTGLREPGAARRLQPAIQPAENSIPTKVKIAAELKGVALDTVLDSLVSPPYQRLGLDLCLTGPATAKWTDGHPEETEIAGTLRMEPTGHALPGEAPAYGTVDATYTQRDGAVDVRKLDLHLPASSLEARGRLGVDPISSPTALSINFQSHSFWEFDTVLRLLGLKQNGQVGTAALPVDLAGQANFQGSWTGSLSNPRLAGRLTATQLAIRMIPNQKDKSGPAEFYRWDTVEATGSYAADRIALEHGLLRKGKTEIALEGTLLGDSETAVTGGKSKPSFNARSLLNLRLRATKVAVEDLLPLAGQDLPLTGALDAQIQVDGPVHNLSGSGSVELDGGTFYREPVARIRAQGKFADQVVKLASVNVSEAAGKISASGSFDLKTRRFQLDASGSGVDVAKIEWFRTHGIAVTGKLGFSILGSGTPDDPRLEAHATLSPLSLGGDSLGSLELVARTAGRVATYDATTNLAGADFRLHGETALSGENATQAKLDFSGFDVGALLKMGHLESPFAESALSGNVTVQGPLARPEKLRGDVRLQRLAVTVAGVVLQSEGGVHATLADGRVSLDPLHVTGEATDLRAQGSLGLKDKRQLDVAASGSINLKLAKTLDPDLTGSGAMTFQVEAHGPLQNPGLQGRIDIQNGSLSFEDLPNGLSQLHGSLEFNQNRLEVKSLTAMTGGGLLSLSGYLAYQHGIYANLSATGKEIRIRYPQGVSSQADATLHLQGPQNNLLLAGDILVARFTVSPALDIAALAEQAGGVQTIAPPDAPSNHIRLDVHLVSSPQLSFQNAYAKLAGDIDLHLRGTVASPSLLGRISITEGDATIAGTRYELQRGDISFTNPVRIEPTIDLNATARVEDYDISLGLRGTPEKLSVTYRSDPPLPEADVVALLALGRTQNQQRIYTQQQEQALSNPTTDALLGGALNATVSSRVQKLFGAGSVKVDPNYLGVLGNSTSRIIVEEQLGRYLTFTYATNVNTTSQQLIQAEVAINRHLSLVVARDESGVFSMVIKATRRFR
jgi:translocation and assembly module TamB